MKKNKNKKFLAYGFTLGMAIGALLLFAFQNINLFP